MKQLLLILILAAGMHAAIPTRADAYYTDPNFIAACETLYYAEIVFLTRVNPTTDGMTIQRAQTAVDAAGTASAAFNRTGAVPYYKSLIYGGV